MRRKQSGQAIILGVLFAGIVVMGMLLVYNQGSLISKRMQLDNASDAVAYSQAKLAARNMNFAAYTNRSMIANEIAMGQMVSLISWANRYGNVSSIVNAFPLYQTPIIPPVPVTYANVLTAAFSAHQIGGVTVQKLAKPIAKAWPKAASAINTTLGLFQRLFAASTIAAQLETSQAIIQSHQPKDQVGATASNDIAMPDVGWMFFLLNSMLTHAANGLNVQPIVSAVNLLDLNDDTDLAVSAVDGSFNVGAGQGTQLASEFLGGQSGQLNSLINGNAPSARSQADKDATTAAYQRYAAIVNTNRPEFTRDRHWSVFPVVGRDLTFKLNFGIAKFEINFKLFIGAGLKADGGSAYRVISNTKTSFDQHSDIEKLGWSAVDMMSLGFSLEVGLGIKWRICLFKCFSGSFGVYPPKLEIGFPIAAGSHQLVNQGKDAFKTYPQYEIPLTEDGQYGGDPDDDVNNGAFSMFHTMSATIGSYAGGGAFGTKSTDVTTTYAGPPAFLSLGDNFRSTRVSYEYVSALATATDKAGTTDRSGIIPDDASGPNENTDSGLNKIALYTQSRMGAKDTAADYQKVIWGADNAISSLSAAEAYFSNPLQMSVSNPEPASLFSPFWDARLKEPSTIAKLIASGDVAWRDLFSALPRNASGILNHLLSYVGGRILDSAMNDALGRTPGFVQSAVQPGVDRISSLYKSRASAAANTLARYVE
ncbi:hypothetical protein [Litorivicinus lipolyticus]|uniref:hypothetical protein n=1 Tax=Litorivicinus lipolyticus TaxID=418701 RepID=UPI003B5AF0EB